LRDRPAWSEAPAGVISVSRRSIAVWMSSSLGANLKTPESSSFLMRRSPRSIEVRRDAVSSPAADSPRAWAMLPAMS
jgi:hypothetical protein